MITGWYLQKTENETLTIRIDSVLLEELKKIAGSAKLSPNSLVTKVICEYVDWHGFAREAGMGYFDRKLVEQLFEQAPNEFLNKLAKHFAENQLKEILLVIRKETTVAAFLSALESWLKASGFSYRSEINEDFTKLVINFNMGKKWAEFCARTYLTLLHQLTTDRVETQVIDCTLVLTISKE